MTRRSLFQALTAAIAGSVLARTPLAGVWIEPDDIGMDPARRGVAEVWPGDPTPYGTLDGYPIIWKGGYYACVDRTPRDQHEALHQK